MLSLTEASRAFVVAMVETGAAPGNWTRCALMAGIGGTPESAQVWASRSMRKPQVLAALREEADKRLQSGALIGAAALVEIASDPMHKDRMKAADRLLDRNGFIVAALNRVEHTHELIESKSTADLRKEISDQIKRLRGVSDQNIIDGEFEEVEDEGSAEGLEDLLAPSQEAAL